MILDSGHTAWMIVATLLVFMMTIPGIALFYGGLVRQKNMLSLVMQSLAIAGVVSILWVVFGYSLALSLIHICFERPFLAKVLIAYSPWAKCPIRTLRL